MEKFLLLRNPFAKYLHCAPVFLFFLALLGLICSDAKPRNATRGAALASSSTTGPARFLSRKAHGKAVQDNTTTRSVTTTFSFSIKPKSVVSGSVRSTSALVGVSGPNPTPDSDMSNNSATVNTTILANDAGLSALSSTVGTLSPAFNIATTDYTTLVPGTTTSVAITPTANQARATMQVSINGGAYAAVPGGNESPALALNKGNNLIDVLVTARDGSTTKIYTIAVNRVAPPTISYSSFQSYTIGTAITPLVPVSSGVATGGYSSSPVTIGSGFTRLVGAAADAAGNIYVADGTGNVIKEIPFGKGLPVTFASITSPQCIAADAAGNVFVGAITSPGHVAIVKVPAGGGTPVTITATGIANPASIALDAADNIYVGDLANHVAYKIPAGGGTAIAIGSTLFNAPLGIAVNAAGNVYVADAVLKKVSMLPVGGGSAVTIAQGFGFPAGVAVDVAGNIFITDSGNLAVKEIPAGGGAQLSIGSGFTGPYGITIDPGGNLYVTDGGKTVKEIPLTGGYYINPALPAGLSFDGNTGIISGTPTAVSQATNYTITAYNADGGSSAVLNITTHILLPAISYCGPESYTIGTAITPLVPVSSGVATGGYSSSPVTIGSGFTRLVGAAADAAGNIYVADGTGNVIKEIPFGKGLPVTFASITSPQCIAADAAGNVFVGAITSPGHVAIVKVPAGGGTPVTITATGIANPASIALDAADNIYVGDLANHVAYKIPAGGGTAIAIGSTLFNAPLGIAVDAAGNVYVADAVLKKVSMLPVGGGSAVTVAQGFGFPAGVAVDVAGNIIITDSGNLAVKEIPAGGGAQLRIGSGFTGPYGITIDPGGNLYVTDGGKTVKEIPLTGGYYINPALPAGLSFDGNTGIISGTPTAVSQATNYTITAYNSGGGGTAAVNINVGPNTSLTNLAISNGTLSPAFAAAATAYTDSVPNITTSITVTPTVFDVNATVKVNGTTVPSGSASASQPLNVGDNNITIMVTAPNGAATSIDTITVTRLPSADARLNGLTLSSGTLSPAFARGTTGYTASVDNSTTSVTVTPTTTNAGATVTVNGTAIPSGSASASQPLNVGDNVITIAVTAPNGIATTTYTITVTRLPSADARLNSLTLSSGTLSPDFARGTTSYTASVNNSTTSVIVTPTTTNAGASVTVNGAMVTSGSAYPSQPLNEGDNMITIVVTAMDGVTINTYRLNVQRAFNSTLSNLAVMRVKNGNASTAILTPGFSPGTNSYSIDAPNTTSTVTITPTVAEATAVVKVNGTTVAPGSASTGISLNVGPNTITTVVTAQDGTTDTYTVFIDRRDFLGTLNGFYQPISVNQAPGLRLEGDGIFVHQGLSPNGDGINDVFTIDGLTNYPDNKVTIMNRNGAVVFQTQGYDNSMKFFDGHSNINGIMQPPGTYFYLLEYKDGGDIKRKTGYIILKY